MKSISGLIIAAAIQANAACAADLHIDRTGDRADLAGSAMPWDGFYFGVTGGYATSNVNASLTPSQALLAFPPSPQMYDFTVAHGASQLGASNVLGGIEAGYRTRFGSFVVGGAFDWIRTNQKKSSSTGTLLMPDGVTPLAFSQSASISQLATVRGVVGLPVGRFLPYITGGVGFGSDRYAQSVVVPGGPGACVCWTGQNSRVQAGWVVGAGLEHALTSRVSVKVEYLRVDLGTLQFTTLGAPNGYPGLDLTHAAKFSDQISKFAIDYKF